MAFTRNEDMNALLSKSKLIILFGLLHLNNLNAQSTWRWLNGGVQSNTLVAVKALDTNIVIAVGDVSTIMKTADGGNHWTAEFRVAGTESYLADVAFSDSKRGIAVGQYGTILLTTDAGESWALQSSRTQSFLSALAYLGNQTWITTSYEGIFYRSTDDGSSWNAVTPGGTYSFNALQFVTANVGFAVGSSGAILKTTDGGLTWQDRSASTSYALRGAFFFNPDTGFVWGDMGVYFQTTNGGATWISHNVIAPLWKVTFINAQVGFATGATNSSLYQTKDSGETWNWIGSGNAISLSFANEKTGFGVGGAGTIIRTQDSGETWQSYSSPIQSTFFRDISFIDSTTGVVTGWDGKILRTTNGGASWDSRWNAGYGYFNSVALKDSAGFVAGGAGTILSTTNQGVDWAIQNGGTANNLNGINFHDSTVLAVGDSGLILRSTNMGLSWTPIQSGTTWSLQSIAMVDGDTMIIVGGEPYVDKGGLILRSTDKGISWTNILGVTTFIINRVAVYKNVAVAVSLRGIIYVSTDYGRTWTPKSLGIQDDLYGITLGSKGNGIICTGSGGVYSTSDTGKSWIDEKSVTASWLYSVCYLKSNTTITVGLYSTILQLITSTSTTVNQSLSSLNLTPKQYRLNQNYPNPFNPSTVISYELQTNGIVTLEIYDMLGRRIATLVSEREDAGIHSVTFNASGLSSGIYFYRLTAGNFVKTKKLMLIR